MDDAQLIEDVYRRRYADFRNALTPVAGSREAARDAVQEGFARALATNTGFRGEGTPDAWLWQICYRAALERHRRPLPRCDSEIDEYVASLSDARADPAVTAAIAALTPRRRQVVFLRYFCDFSYSEIASALEISTGTVSASLAQAHAELLGRLTEMGRVRV